MAELTREHPLEQFGIEADGAHTSAVSITAEPYLAMVDVRLPATAPLAGSTVLGAAWPTSPNTWVSTGSGRLIWLAPGEWLLTSTAHDPDELEDRARESVRPLGGAAVDVSAQRIALRLRGSHARDVLAKGCSIDLHPRVFRSGSAAQTTVGLAGVILLALPDTGDADQGDFLLLVRASFSRYLADWLLDAAQEFNTAELANTAADPTGSQE